ncbi:LysR family transcriptional regulator [Mycolicibacterium sp. 120270]|uniref:LysR family transcriptional regulator n=1 Tax=Mycolicibacterium sp. 120270 TaxID=3090600 RepID=UPI00299D3E88|nr:LysR family transcriptional regulator [Mycolicibacterium sp. 120270]MDX1887381.1 LysR family transcriptional regulator [Mycolicibacterium sp. 120270]
MSTLLQLKAFVAVVDHGGFTPAGDHLGLSQPAVSRAVAALEKELGLRLLIRTRDGVSPTEAGFIALMHAREVVAHMTSMHAELAGLVGDVTGTLSVASLPSATAPLIAPQLREFAARHPAVTIRLLEGSEQEVLDWLDQGAAEAGVVRLPARGLRTAKLGDQEMVAIVPADNWLASKEVVSYGELAKEPFIRGTGGCADVLTPIAQQAGVEFDVAFEAREITAVLEIVRAGLGVSVAPSIGLPDLPTGVVMRPLEQRTVRPLGLAISASASAPARALLDQIAALDLP